MSDIKINILSRILNFSIGLIIIIILSLLMNQDLKKIRIRFVIQLLAIEIIFGYFILHSKIGKESIQGLCRLFDSLLSCAAEGTNFVFGSTNLQLDISIFFLKVLCPIIFISAIIGVLQYSRILIYTIKIGGSILSKISGMGKLESFNVISSLILGQSENFIVYKSVMNRISEPRIYNMAATAMSTVSLSMISVYMNLLNPKYVVAALILNMFSTFIILSILNPYVVDERQDLHLQDFFIKNRNFFEIIGDYILIGFKIATTVAAMLIGFIALISAFNAIFQTLFRISLQEILSYIFFPLAWVIGIPLHEALPASNIMATKLISNEFIAIINLQKISHILSDQSLGILSVFLVSFSNFASIGIIIGAIKKINHNQGIVISHYGFKLIYSSTLINMLSALIAGAVM